MSADFIKMISELHSQKYSVQIQKLAEGKIPCGFFCGFRFNSSDDIVNIVEPLKNSGINLTCLCVIADLQLPNLKVRSNINVPVVTLGDLSKLDAKPAMIFYINKLYDAAFHEYFRYFGIEDLLLSDIRNEIEKYDFYAKNLPNLYSVHEMLSDEESKRVFRAAIKGRLTNRISDFVFAPEPQYFLNGFFPVEGDIAIDGGAYDGATARDFSMQGAKVYAFEMSADNYKTCLARADKYNFVIENLGLSNKEGEGYYNKGGGTGCSKNPNGDTLGHFIDLDTYVLKKDLPRVDYIKLDIEGAELEMLHGAAKTISRWKPKMAISAYHRLDDLWTLATYIKSIRPDYEFAFRHYRVDCTDYTLTDDHRKILNYFGMNYLIPTDFEMVLYCR